MFGDKQECFSSFKQPHQKMEPRINKPIGQGKFALKKDAKVYNLKESYIVGDVARNFPHIYETLGSPRRSSIINDRN